MNNSQKAKMWGRLCFLVAVVKMAICLVIVLFGAASPPPPIHIGFAWMKVGICVLAVGTSLIPFYKDTILGKPERVDARRYVGFGFGLEGLSDIIHATWSRELHLWLWPLTFLFAILFLISLFYFQGPDDKPRKKRRFKAKWPSWAKKWAQIPRHHRPQPQPQPNPSPARIDGMWTRGWITKPAARNQVRTASDKSLPPLWACRGSFWFSSSWRRLQRLGDAGLANQARRPKPSTNGERQIPSPFMGFQGQVNGNKRRAKPTYPFPLYGLRGRF